jgi:hypothetical protein
MKKNILSLIAVVLGMTLSINNPASAATSTLYFTVINESDHDLVFGPETSNAKCYNWLGNKNTTGDLSQLVPVNSTYTYTLDYQYPANQSCKNPLVDSFIISKSPNYANGCEIYYSCSIDSTGLSVDCTSASHHNGGGDSLCKVVSHQGNTIIIDYQGNPSGGIVVG